MTILYTIDSQRPRHEIIATYARTHNLTVAEIDALVRQLPDYGLRSQLCGALAAVTRETPVIVLADRRARRVG
jgi:hypothetical protein